jgi:hypothetical protein
MIVGHQFDGDNQDHVKWLQHDVYGSCVGLIAREAIKAHLAAAAIMGIQEEKELILAKVTTFDHRCLQDGHDLIAGEFRRQKSVELQPVLPLTAIPEKDRIVALWRDWLETEVCRLCENPRFVRHVTDILAFQNTDRGYAAEDSLCTFLEESYPDCRKKEPCN